MYRAFINQPSTLQPLHEYHGLNVLAEDSQGETIRVWPISGDIISMEIPKLCLSEGSTKDHTQELITMLFTWINRSLHLDCVCEYPSDLVCSYCLAKQHQALIARIERK